jgi:hypothetical protein
MIRRWLVWVDGSPVAPDVPLEFVAAAAEFEREVMETIDPETGEHEEITVEIRQCDEEALRWAGVLR